MEKQAHYEAFLLSKVEYIHKLEMELMGEDGPRAITIMDEITRVQKHTIYTQDRSQ